MVPDRQMDPYFAEFVPLTKEMEPKAHMHQGSSFSTFLEGSSSFATGNMGTCWDRERGVLRLEHSARIPVPGQEACRGDYCYAAPVAGSGAAACGECEGIGKSVGGEAGKGGWDWDVGWGLLFQNRRPAVPGTW